MGVDRRQEKKNSGCGFKWNSGSPITWGGLVPCPQIFSYSLGRENEEEKATFLICHLLEKSKNMEKVFFFFGKKVWRKFVLTFFKKELVFLTLENQFSPETEETMHCLDAEKIG